MLTGEEKRLAARYLTTDTKIEPPKPKWSETKSVPVQENKKRELPQLNIHRPKMKQTETEKLLGAGLSEEEIIAKKKRELEQKAYMKKKKESAKDLGKWKEKDQEAARRDLDSRQETHRRDQEARERDIRAAEERRLQEQRFQLEREQAIVKEAHFHSKEFSAAPKRSLPQDQVQYPPEQLYTVDETPARVAQPQPEETIEVASNVRDTSTNAQKEEQRLKSRWLI